MPTRPLPPPSTTPYTKRSSLSHLIYTHTYICTCILMCAHAYKHMYITDTYTHVYINTKAHTCRQPHNYIPFSFFHSCSLLHLFLPPPLQKRKKKNCTPKNRGVIIIISNNDSRTTVQIRCVCGGAGRGHHLLIRAFTSFLRFFSWVYLFFFCTFKKVSRKIAKATTLDTRQKKKKKMKSPGDSVIQNLF